MNRLERLDDFEESLAAAFHGMHAELWTSLPAIIQSFDSAKQTCTAQPTIQGQVTQSDGSKKWVTLPLLVDVPVHFPSGGGYTLTFPVAHGDEALIVFASRCIDAWWQSGGIQQQAEMRMHDLSDGFAFVGFRSQVRLLAGGVKSGAAQLRSDDGSTYVELAGNKANIVAPGGLTITGPVTINGTVTQAGGALSSNGVKLNDHKHSGVQTGSGSTGGPT